jgi:hypothetical protein
MLLRRERLEGIRDGAVSLVFRRWKRPTVKAGGRLLTAVGELAIEAVDRVEPGSITADEAAAAGYDDLATLRAELDRREEGSVYRIRVSWAGADPRTALRDEVPTGDALVALAARVRALDRSPDGEPWSVAVLRLIRDHPATLAADLAASMGMDRDPFKRRVRRLKALGLTESLETGYRLSPRGRAVLEALERDG